MSDLKRNSLDDDIRKLQRQAESGDTSALKKLMSTLARAGRLEPVQIRALPSLEEFKIYAEDYLDAKWGAELKAWRESESPKLDAEAEARFRQRPPEDQLTWGSTWWGYAFKTERERNNWGEFGTTVCPRSTVEVDSEERIPRREHVRPDFPPGQTPVGDAQLDELLKLRRDQPEVSGRWWNPGVAIFSTPERFYRALECLHATIYDDDAISRRIEDIEEDNREPEYAIQDGEWWDLDTSEDGMLLPTDVTGVPGWVPGYRSGESGVRRTFPYEVSDEVTEGDRDEDELQAEAEGREPQSDLERLRRYLRDQGMIGSHTRLYSAQLVRGYAWTYTYDQYDWHGPFESEREAREDLYGAADYSPAPEEDEVREDLESVFEGMLLTVGYKWVWGEAEGVV